MRSLGRDRWNWRIDLTEEETAALLHELDQIIDGNRYPFSPRIRIPRVVSEALSVVGRGCELFELMPAHDLEGIVEKRLEEIRMTRARTQPGRDSKAPQNRDLPPTIAPQREHGVTVTAKLSSAERAAIVARMDAGTASKADWAAWTAAIADSA